MHDRFLIRLFWITVAAAFLIVLPRYLPILESYFAPTSTSQRLVTARGDLASDEKSTIELFERSKDSVVYISTKQQPFLQLNSSSLRTIQGRPSAR